MHRWGHVGYLARYLAGWHTAYKMLETEQQEPLEGVQSTPESICAWVAKNFGVKKAEIALLEVTGTLLKFVYPAELKTVGAIPVSSSAVAARTARNKRAELFNTFTRVKHSSVFEVVKIGEGGSGEVIQKLMSAPVYAESGDVIGVVQVSRKSDTPRTAGPDFTSEDLRKLQSVAVAVGKLMSKNKS